MVAVCVALVLSGCTVDTSVGGTGGTDGGGGRDAAADGARVDAPLPDGATLDGTSADGGSDAGALLPTEAVTVTTSGGYDGHPAVAWDGERFVVGIVTASGGGHRIEVFYMEPGDVTPLERSALTNAARERRAVAVAASDDGRVAVGWHEYDGATWDVVVALLPSMPLDVRRINDVFAQSDHPSVALAWDGGELLGLLREPEIAGQSIHGVHVNPTPARIDPMPLAQGDVEGIALSAGPGGVLAAIGTSQQVWRHAAMWEPVFTAGLATPQEVALARLTGGSVLVLLSDSSTTPRENFAVRLDRSGPSWAPAYLARPVGLSGPDPASDAVGDQAVVAYVDETSGGRAPAIGLVDREGALVAGPCALPSVLPVANDPDVACGAGWCAIVWIEASARDATDYVTRIIQIPVGAGLVCP